MSRSTTKKTLRLFWAHAIKYPYQLAGMLLIMPILQLSEDFIVPLITSRIITQISHPTAPLNIHMFVKPLLLILVLDVGTNFFWRPFVKILWRFEENVMRDLLKTSFHHFMQMSYGFYTNRFAGSLVSQANKLAGSFERLTDALTWNVYKLIISFIFTIIILVRPAPLYVVSLLIFSSIYVAILLRLKRTERTYNERWAVAETKRTGRLADSITNIMAVKAFAQEGQEELLFKQSADRVHDRSIDTMKRVMHNEHFTATSQRLINIGAIVSSVYLASHFSIPVGTIYLALIYTLSIMRRLWDLNGTLRNLNRVFGDAREMTEILEIEPEIKDPAQPEQATIHRGAIHFDNVKFGYKDRTDELLFDNLNLSIKPGEKIGLVGHSGGGKTTLTQLLLRFIDVSGGSILIDGQNIAHISQEDLRRNIAYVPQEPLMFHRSITDNIRYGRLEASDREVKAVAKMAHAHDFIDQLPQGYDTLVGERGTKLSGGQRQRIAIARAMIKNAPILLLDEATSALDSESEQLIQDALWKLMEGRTAIVIAHRLSTIQRMDRIVVLENGKIAEEGTHKELIRNDGIYAQLWNRQSGGFLEE